MGVAWQVDVVYELVGLAVGVSISPGDNYASEEALDYALGFLRRCERWHVGCCADWCLDHSSRGPQFRH